jgi:hypothetical protein
LDTSTLPEFDESTNKKYEALLKQKKQEMADLRQEYEKLKQ